MFLHVYIIQGFMVVHKKFFLITLALLIIVGFTSACTQTDEQIYSEDIQQSSPPISTQNTSESIALESQSSVTDIVTPTSKTEATTETIITANTQTGKSGDYDSSDTIELLETVKGLIDSAEKVNELRSALLNLSSVNEVQIFRNADEVQNSELQIFDGDAVEGIVVVIFYENGKSWAEFTKG